MRDEEYINYLVQMEESQNKNLFISKFKKIVFSCIYLFIILFIIISILLLF